MLWLPDLDEIQSVKISDSFTRFQGNNSKQMHNIHLFVTVVLETGTNKSDQSTFDLIT